MAYRPKHVVEYLALRGIVGIMGRLPLRLALGLAWVIAALSYLFMGGRSREARRRMRQVFGPDIPEAQLRAWAWKSWRNLIFNVIEIARAPRLTMKDLDRHIDYQQLHRCVELNRKAGGFTMAVCHMGNWDLAGFAARMIGLPIFVMMRGQTNPLVTRYIEQIRAHFDIGFIERHKALGSIIKRIRAGEVFTILPDLRAKTRDSAVPIPFLGHPAHLMGGAALFARLTNTPIVTAIVTRAGWTRHHIEVQEPLYPQSDLDRDVDVRRLMTEMMARFDAAIRKYPDQYFWFNKRWVLDDRFDEDAGQ